MVARFSPNADDSGINEVTDTHGSEFTTNKQFVRPFPPQNSRNAYSVRQHGLRSDADLNPDSPSVSVHVVNVPSPLALQQTR